MTDVAVASLRTRSAASTSAAMDRPSTYLPALDGLRGVAVLMVIAYHFTEDRSAWFRGGWIGVDVFFVLSGYLVTRLLVVPGGLGLPDVVAFLQRRVARLVPALPPFIAAGAVCLLLDPDLLGRTVSGSQPTPVSWHQYVTTWGTALSGWANFWAADGGKPVAALGHL